MSKSVIKNYLKHYCVFILLSLVLMVCEVTLNLWQPKLMAGVVDNGVLNSNVDYILEKGIEMLIIAVCSGTAGYFSTFTSGLVAAEIGNDLRVSFYKKSISLDGKNITRFSSETLLNRLSIDINTLMNFTSEIVHIFIKPLILFAGGIIMIFSMNASFGGIVLISLPFQLLLMILLVKKTSAIFDVIQKRLDKIAGSIRENTIAARVIKGFNKKDSEIKKFKLENEEIVNLSVNAWQVSAVINAMIMIVMNLVVVVVIYVGGLQAEAKAFQIGNILAAITYVQQILMSIMIAGQIFQHISKSKVAFGRLAEVFKVDTDKLSMQENLNNEIDTISFRNVSCKNSANEYVLKTINLDIIQGEKVGILGVTGSGKTSIINAILGFISADDGEVLINNINIERLASNSIRNKISVASQDDGLFAGTIKENIEWGFKVTDNQYIESAKIAEAHTFIMEQPKEYYSYVEDKGNNLSGGQKQRILLARAVNKQGEILIIDDALSEVEKEIEYKIFDTLFEKYSQRTMIVVSHSIPILTKCDKIIIMDKGKIIESGNHYELLDKSKYYRELYDNYC